MFFRIFSFELKYKFSRPGVYIYWVILFALSFLIVNMFSGLIEGVTVSIAGMGGKVMTNAPHTIYSLVSGLSFMGMILIPAVIGSSIYRDYESNAHALLFSYPISRFGYLGGRFLGGFVAAIFVFSSIGFGIWLSSYMPYLNQDLFGDNIFLAYISPYISNVIPNIFVVGILIFAIAAISRNLLATYLGCIVLLVLYGVAGSLIADIENTTISSIIDPFGGTAFETLTKYWTVTEKNELLIPFTWLILFNRIIWLAFASLVFGFLLNKFKFTQNVFQLKFRKNSRLIFANINPITKIYKLNLPRASQKFNFKAKYNQLRRLIKFETVHLVKNPYFLGILATGILYIIMMASQIGTMYGTTTYPVTYQVADVLGTTFFLFVFIILTFLSGEIVWKERSYKVNEIIDAMPIPTWSIYVSKLSALVVVQFILMAVVMLIGIFTQAAMGYYKFEIGLYIKELFMINMSTYVLFCVLAFIVHVLVNNKYMGHFIMILLYFFLTFMGAMGLEHNLYNFASDPGIMYSDMNGYGHYVMPFITYKGYWFAFAIILAIVSNLLWVRGNENVLSKRFSLLKQRLTTPTKIALTACVLVFIALGSYIYYNTNILNEYIKNKEYILDRVDYENKYRKYEDFAQPRIVEINMDVDLFPKERDAFFKGYYYIKNKSNQSIDSLIVNHAGTKFLKKFECDVPTVLVYDDTELDFRIYKFEQSLQPGDSIKVDIEVEVITKGFRNRGSNTRLLENGTFITNSYLPSLGYNKNYQLTNERKRKKYDLPELQLVADQSDTTALMNTYIASDGDWIRFETVVSTVPEQTAIAPGYLEKEWEENGRKYFHYKMDSRVLNFSAWLSAEYEKLEDSWNGIDLAIYYHKGHEYNVEDMMKSMKMSLEYFSENFSPFQYKQLRIFEFPRFSAFAQSFPNMIPFSESIGFIANVEDEDVNYPFWVTSHEVAHQWWAHQVIGGDAAGATLMSEVLCQYSSSKVIEKAYGIETLRDMMKYDLNSYLTGRSSEMHYEPALIDIRHGQGYLHYRKGNIVMYALADYIGDDKINEALKAFANDYAFQEPPFVTSHEFIKYLKEVTPDSLQYVITDMFEKIILFENKITDASYEEMEDGKYKVNFSVECKKFESDSMGREKQIEINDWIDVAVFTKEANDSTKKETELIFKKFKIDQDQKDFEFIVDHKPNKVGIDPYLKLIDRHTEDNTKNVGILN